MEGNKVMADDTISVQSPDGITIHVPKTKVKLDNTGNFSEGTDWDYLNKAIQLHKENNKPIFNSNTLKEGFLGGLYHSTIQPMVENPGRALMGVSPTLSKLYNIFETAKPIITGEANDPNYQIARKNAANENIRQLPGISDYNRIASGDYSGEAGELLPQTIMAIAGMSPKVRALAPGFMEGAAKSPITPMRHGLYNTISSVPGLIGAGIGYGVHPNWEGMALGGLIGSKSPEILSHGVAGIEGATKAFADEPRLFNWSTPGKIAEQSAGDIPVANARRFSPTSDIKMQEEPAINIEGSADINKYPFPTVHEPEVLEPGPHPFQYSGNPLNRRLTEPNIFERIFNMPGDVEPGRTSFTDVDYETHDFPQLRLQLQAPASYQMPPAGAHILDPQELRGLPPSNLWEDRLQLPSRSRGAIPIGGRNIEGRNVSAEGRVYGKKSNTEVTRTPKPKENVPKGIKGPTEESPTEEMLRRSDSETSTKSNTITSLNTITSPETAVKPEGESKYISMSDAAGLSKNLGLPYQDMIKYLKNEGYTVVSDWEVTKKKLGTYGLNIKGRKVD